MSGLDFRQHQEHQELYARTFIALERARDLGLPADDLSLLCWHSGIDSKLLTKENGNAENR